MAAMVEITASLQMGVRMLLGVLGRIWLLGLGAKAFVRVRRRRNGQPSVCEQVGGKSSCPQETGSPILMGSRGRIIAE